MKENFINEIINRFKSPWKHFGFKSYFFWVVIVFGGIGISMTIRDVVNSKTPDLSIVSKSIATTFVAIIAASLVDLNLSYSIKNVPSLIINSMGFTGISILLMILSFNIQGAWSLLPAIFGYMLALSIWILANADNDKLFDDNYLQQINKKVKDLENSVGDI